MGYLQKLSLSQNRYLSTLFLPIGAPFEGVLARQLHKKRSSKKTRGRTRDVDMLLV
jgi:hypothetical protein